MATRTKAVLQATAPAGDGGGAGVADAPAPQAHPPASAYKTVWLRYSNTAAGRPGWRLMLKTEADALIASGDAQDPYTAGWLKPISKKPPPSSVNVSVTAISAANPAVATLSAGDVTKLTSIQANQITLSGAGGADAAAINKAHAFTVADATHITLTALDNSAPLVFTGLPLAGVGRKV